MKFGEWTKVVAGTAREHLGVAAVSVCVVVAIGILATSSFAGCSKPDTAALADTFPVKAAEPTATPAPKPSAKPQPKDQIIVYVTGAVKRPGVYTLTGGDARLYHAIRAAGGFKPNAITDALNLADRAQDGDQLNVPSRKPTKTSPPVQQPISLARQRTPSVAQPPLIRKPLLPAPIVLPLTSSSEENAPTITVIETPPPPSRILGVPPVAVSEPTAPPPTETVQVIPFAPAQDIITPSTTSRKTERSTPKASPKFKNPGDGIVHINTATAAELEQLPRCGPAMSAKILAYRAQIGRFTNLKQLLDVSS